MRRVHRLGRVHYHRRYRQLSSIAHRQRYRQFGKWTARQFALRYCRGSINRELPGQFENIIADIYDIAKGGDARARACLKLLKEPRFRK
jgi:hypothetical protein